MIFHLLVPCIIILTGWLSIAWSADVTPAPSPPGNSPSESPQAPSTPPPSRIDPGIERRPQTVPDPRSAVVPPKVDPKMTIDPETAPPAMDTKPGSSPAPQKTPPAR